MTMQHFVVHRELNLIHSCNGKGFALHRPTHNHQCCHLMVLTCLNGIRPSLHNPNMFAWYVRWLSQMAGLFCPQSKTVEELWATLHVACKMLPSKIILVSQLFLFSFSFFCTHSVLFISVSDCIFFSNTVATEPMAQEWNLIILECYICYNQVIIVHKVFIMTRPSLSFYTYRPIHHIMEYERKKRPIAFFLFSLSHLISYDASEHDMFPCVI